MGWHPLRAETDIPEVLPPVFSQHGGFYQDGFNLHIENPHPGTYDYVVTKAGYDDQSGQVTIESLEKEIVVTLTPNDKESAFTEYTEGQNKSGTTHDVDFCVDVTASPWEQDDEIYISGDFTEPAWPEPGSDPEMLLERQDNDSLFCIHFDLEAGHHQYKYFLNPGWGDGEWGGQPNREVTVYGDTIFHDIWGVIDPDDPDDPDPHDPGTATINFVIQDPDNNPIEDATIFFDGQELAPGEYVITDVMPAAVIRYTTDGSIPDSTSDVYDAPILITSREGDPNTISLIPTNNLGEGHHYNENWQPPAGEIFKIHTIRARAFLPNGRPGQTETHSYLVDEQGFQRYSLPLISITAHESAFFDADSGIYVQGNHTNYHQRGREWERLVHFEFFEKNGSLAFSQDMGARIHGGTSRNRPRKSLRMYARRDYGTTWVDYQLFPDKEIHEYKRFILRNSGNDWSESIFRDAFMQTLMKDLELDLQYARPAIVFLNGEYWGVHTIRDRLDNRYIQTHYGLSDEMDYTILERDGQLDRGNPDGIRHYEDMLAFLESPGAADPENYAEIKTRMDVENFTNYQIGQIYVMNTDWPGNNIQYWRYYTDEYDPDAPEGLDGRWRWQVFDLDFGFGLDFDYVTGVNEGPAHNTLSFALEAHGPNWPNPPWSTFILRKLMENDTYRQHFITRFADLLNTSFEENRVLDVLEDFYETYKPEMPEHIHRWRMPENMQSWEDDVDVMRDFALQRGNYMRQYLAEEFNLGEEALLEVMVVNPSQGTVRVNTVETCEGEAPWQGTYFEGMEITLEAIPAPGYIFSHWEGVEENHAQKTSLTLDGDTEVMAHFQSGLIHYWHFNNLPDGHLQIVEADQSMHAPGVITYPGSGAGYMDRTDGTQMNAHQGVGAGYGLRARNPSDTRQLTIRASSEGYQDVMFSYATRRTPNGAREQTLYYSTDAGENYTQLGDTYTVTENFAVHHVDLGDIPKAQDNADLRFRILFSGDEASGIEGNNRFDNVVLTGKAMELTLGPAQPPAGYLHEDYGTHYFTASGGKAPYSYSLTEGNLPDGLTLESNGRLSGKPAESGVFSFTVKVADHTQAQQSREFTLEVEDQSLMHYWHFNNLPDGQITYAHADWSLFPDGASISYPGTGDGYMDRTDGTTQNSQQDAHAGFGLRVRNPSDTRELVIAASSENFENLTLRYAVHRTTNGTRQQEIHYSPDGGLSWTYVESVEYVGEHFQVREFDLSDYDEVDNNPDLQISILFVGEEATGASGNNRFDNISIHGTRTNVSAEDPAEDHSSLLEQNHPNPFRGTTTIPFKIDRGGDVRIDVFNLEGLHIETLLDEHKNPGRHEVVFNGNSYPAGVYIYRLQAPGSVRSRQMILMN